MIPNTPNLEVYFRRKIEGLISVETQMNELFQFCTELGKVSPLLDSWYLASDKGKEDAYFYPAFDKSGPTTAALAVLHTKYKNVADIRSIAVWNGVDVPGEGASVGLIDNALGRPNNVSLQLQIRPIITDWHVADEWLKSACDIWHPNAIAFGPYFYDDNKVFKDRPGVGWMLYLPKILTVQQVPEASALIPVMKDKKQIGTIIVSVTDAPFDINNPEHIRIANSIEIRLVDQDLLPKFADL